MPLSLPCVQGQPQRWWKVQGKVRRRRSRFALSPQAGGAGLSTPGFIAWVVPALLLGFSLPGHGRGMGCSHPAPGGPEGSSKDALYQSREGEPWVLLAAGMPRENASG